MIENDGWSHRPPDAPRVTVDMLRQGIDVLRQRLRDEDDVEARRRLRALVRELELGQAILEAARRGQDDDKV